MQSPVAAIVVLEDEPNDAFFVRRAFEKAHIINPVIVFATTSEARDYFDESRRSEAPALFILDVKLAGGDNGIAFLRWVRQQRLPLGTTPAMMFTASSSAVDRDEAQMFGSIYFLRKPMTEEALIAAVQSLGLAVTVRSSVSMECAIERRP
jgi:DNA-binding response OmpR family regulator